ncbi:ribosomal RNA small subunit methyltransferase A [Candidatus Saccharibacteria bacterium]|nr:ribosomal RNA small subunit methyltransferase A [Candidatus Saccharibacteria bacterium]
MKAKKSFGQNWLRDEYVLDEIVKSAEIAENDTVLEVGPGLGTLTQKLVATGADVVAVEADKDLLPRLGSMFQGEANFELVNDDILKFDLSKLNKDYKVVANIPYYLTSNLLRTLLESNNPPSTMVLLVQKEVAQRIMAKPGQMSVLAFSVQYYAKPEYIMDVKKELFDPVPKVDSAVIKIIRGQRPAFEADIKKLFRLVKAGFGEKRKMLRNSISGGLGIETLLVENLLKDCKLKPTARAQELSLKDWQGLYSQALQMGII